VLGLLEHHGFNVPQGTLRKWMSEDGLWLSRKQRRRFIRYAAADHDSNKLLENIRILIEIDRGLILIHYPDRQ